MIIEFLNKLIKEFEDCEHWKIEGFVDKPEGNFQEQEGNVFEKIYVNQHQSGEDSFYGNIYIPIEDKFLKINYSM